MRDKRKKQIAKVTEEYACYSIKLKNETEADKKETPFTLRIITQFKPENKNLTSNESA